MFWVGIAFNTKKNLFRESYRESKIANQSARDVLNRTWNHGSREKRARDPIHAHTRPDGRRCARPVQRTACTYWCPGTFVNVNATGWAATRVHPSLQRTHKNNHAKLEKKSDVSRVRCATPFGLDMAILCPVVPGFQPAHSLRSAASSKAACRNEKAGRWIVKRWHWNCLEFEINLAAWYSLVIARYHKSYPD